MLKRKLGLFSYLLVVLIGVFVLFGIGSYVYATESGGSNTQITLPPGISAGTYEVNITVTGVGSSPSDIQTKNLKAIITVPPPGACGNGANNPPTCNTCTAPLVWNGASCGSPLSITVSPTNYPATLPNSTISASYTLTNGTSANTTCRLLNNVGSPINSYVSCNSPTSVTAPAVASTYAYFIQAYKASTGETKTSNQFTVAVSSGAGATSGDLTASDCTIASGASSCNTNLSWYTDNPVGTSAVKTTPGITVATANSGTGFYPVAHGTRVFYLYNNGVALDPPGGVIATASCTSGTVWDGSKCAASNVAPVPTNATISPKPINPNGTSTYTITTVGTDANGGADIDSQYALINFQGVNAGVDQERGYIGWSSTQGISGRSFLNATPIDTPISCAGGGGYGSRLANHGDAYINPIISCSTSVSGNTRTSTFVVSFKPAFTTPTTNNTISSWVSDVGGLYDSWKPFGTFDLTAAATPDLTAGPISPTSAFVGTPVVLSALVSNIGGAGTGSSFPNYIITRNGPGGTGVDIYDPAITAPVLSAGGSEIVAAPAYAFTSAGTYSAALCVDFGPGWVSTINESNEGNNCGPWTNIAVNVTATCDPSVIGTNQMSGCSYSGMSFNTLAAISTLTGPTLSNPAPVSASPLPYVDWGAGGPGTLVDNYSVRWKGRYNFSAGNYTFSTNSDDGSRAYFDDNGDGSPDGGVYLTPVSYWSDHGPGATSGSPVTVTAGQHTLIYEMYESGGGAAYGLSWTSVPLVTDACGTGSSATYPQLTEPTTGTLACNPGVYANSPPDTVTAGSQAWNWSCGTVTTCSAPKYGCRITTDSNYDLSAYGANGPNNNFACSGVCENGATSGYPTCTPSGGGACVPPWNNPSWGYRKKITLKGSQISGTVSNFPVLISRTDTDLQAHAQPNGNDIFFTNSSGTKLSHEIETYTSSSGKLIAWVKVPSVSSSADTDIYMYYGGGATNQQDAANVWNSGYKSVIHFKETSGTLSDSSGNNNTASPSGGAASTGSGPVGSAYSFDGNDGKVTITNNASWAANTTKFSIEFWIKVLTPRTYAGAVAAGNWADTTFQINNSDPVNTWGSQVTQTGPPWTSVGANSSNLGYLSTADNTFHHVAVVFNADAGRYSIYNDGVEVGYSVYTAGTTNLGAKDLYIGGFGNGLSLNSVIDEVRISNGAARSANWIATEYRNQSNPGNFYNIGSQEDYASCSAGATTASITANGNHVFTNISNNGPVVIDWNYSNATSCMLDPASIGTISIPPSGGSGTFSTSLTQTKIYTITCLPVGPNSIDTVTVNVPAQPKDLTVIKTGQGIVTSTPSGINCGAGCQSQTASFPSSTTVVLTATKATGRIFTGWTGCDSSTKAADGSGGTCTVTLNSPKTVLANFAVDPNYKEF